MVWWGCQKQTNLILLSERQYYEMGGMKESRWSAYYLFYREDWINKRAKILGWGRNDLEKEGAGNGHPPHANGTMSTFILGAADSRTKDWWLDGDSICISSRAFSNNEHLWSRINQRQGELPAGPCLGWILAWRPTRLPWLPWLLMWEGHLEYRFSGFLELETKWLWNKNTDLKKGALSLCNVERLIYIGMGHSDNDRIQSKH